MTDRIDWVSRCASAMGSEPGLVARCAAAGAADADWVARIAAGVAALAAAGNVLFTIYSRNRDRKDKREQARRDVAASDFTAEVRTPILEVLARLEDGLAEVDLVLNQQEVLVDGIRVPLQKLMSVDIPAAFSQSLDIASRCTGFAALKHIELRSFIQAQQDALAEKSNGFLSQCRNAATAVTSASGTRASVLSACLAIRGELARINEEISGVA